MTSAIVIGAGITGITTAYYLARQGFDVTVLEKEHTAGMLTSYANGGQLSVSNSEVWNTWPNVLHGIQWMFNSSAPLKVGFPTLSKSAWMTKFLLHTAIGSYKKNTMRTIEMGLAARNCYADIIEQESIEFDHAQNGILHFYNNQKSFEKAKESCKLYWDMNVDRHIITADQVIEHEPTLAHQADNIVGGTYTKSDGMGDIHKFCVNLAKVCETKYNVKFAYNTEVLSISYYDVGNSHIQTNDKDYGADHVVICAGVYSDHVAAKIHWLNETSGEYSDLTGIYPVKGYSITVPRGNGILPTVSLLDDAAKIVSSTLGDRLRVAGTAELAGWNLDIRKQRTDPLLNWAKRYFPDLDYENVIPWAGLRPMSSDMMPVVRRHHAHRNIWFNTGHGHLGWTLAAYTAKQVSSMIVDAG